MGEGHFIMPLNATMRKQLRKQQGDTLHVSLEKDPDEYVLHEVLISCLQEEPVAWKFFNALPGSHQRYYSKYIDAAKTENTQAKRIARVVRAMQLHLSYAEMLRMDKEKNW